jgi:HK97 family phage prohead protease
MPPIPSNPPAPSGLFELRGVEFRQKDENVFAFRGHAAVFDSLSENLGGFREVIKRGAFKDVLTDDVRLLVNHDSNLLLARTASGTLTLEEKPEGLFVEADIDARQSYANDLKIAMERGDMNQMSFAFGSGVEDDWEEDGEGRLVRTIKRFKSLFDVSAVTYPAYPATDAGFRAISRLARGEEVTDEEWVAIETLRSSSTSPEPEVRDSGADAQEPAEEVAGSEGRVEVEDDSTGAGISAEAARRRLALLERADA